MNAIAQTFLDTAVLDLDALRHMTYDELHCPAECFWLCLILTWLQPGV